MDSMLRKLDSATKYPSIQTFHVIADRGRLSETLTPMGEIARRAPSLSATEKLDGTNVRMIFTRSRIDGDGDASDWFLGAREHLVMACGDRCPNSTEGIAEHLAPIMGRLQHHIVWTALEAVGDRIAAVLIVYGELYGGKVGANAKHYAQDRSVGFRVFDTRTMTAEDFALAQAMDPTRLAMLRDEYAAHPGRWHTDNERHALCAALELPEVPSIAVPGTPIIPTTIDGAFEWLNGVVGTATRAAINENPPGRPEGLVVRTPDRSAIVKFRYEEYERTLRNRKR